MLCWAVDGLGVGGRGARACDVKGAGTQTGLAHTSQTGLRRRGRQRAESSGRAAVGAVVPDAHGDMPPRLRCDPSTAVVSNAACAPQQHRDAVSVSVSVWCSRCAPGWARPATLHYTLLLTLLLTLHTTTLTHYHTIPHTRQPQPTTKSTRASSTGHCNCDCTCNYTATTLQLHYNYTTTAPLTPMHRHKHCQPSATYSMHCQSLSLYICEYVRLPPSNLQTPIHPSIPTDRPTRTP